MEDLQLEPDDDLDTQSQWAWFDQGRMKANNMNRILLYQGGLVFAGSETVVHVGVALVLVYQSRPLSNISTRQEPSQSPST